MREDQQGPRQGNHRCQPIPRRAHFVYNRIFSELSKARKPVSARCIVHSAQGRCYCSPGKLAALPSRSGGHCLHTFIQV